MIDKIGLTELIVVGVVLLILFGGRKIPELGKGIADSIRHIRSIFEGDKKNN